MSNLIALKTQFTEATQLDANKTNVVSYFQSIGNIELLKQVATLNYSAIATWELIISNLESNNDSDNIDDYLIGDNDNNEDDINLDLPTNRLLAKLPRIPLQDTCILSDKVIAGKDTVVALDGIPIANEKQKTKLGVISVSYGVGNVVIRSANDNKCILIGTLSNFVNKTTKNCFTPIDENIDRELISDAHNSKAKNVYKVARETAIATWDYNKRAIAQVQKLSKEIDLMTTTSYTAKLISTITSLDTKTDKANSNK